MDRCGAAEETGAELEDEGKSSIHDSYRLRRSGTHLYSSTQRQRQARLYEFKASLVYMVPG